MGEYFGGLRTGPFPIVEDEVRHAASIPNPPSGNPSSSARVALYQSPQASTLYTKFAKSAKKELEVARCFALFAPLV